ncbi:hypothetical protein BZA77DRAFT_316764 [Pyronema omphalodes]|nr:hypothetical protein BZA77DRAFT_316764 [Pyronema omphalodes]
MEGGWTYGGTIGKGGVSSRCIFWKGVHFWRWSFSCFQFSSFGGCWSFYILHFAFWMFFSFLFSAYVLFCFVFYKYLYLAGQYLFSLFFCLVFVIY